MIGSEQYVAEMPSRVETDISRTFNDLSLVPGHADFYPEDVLLVSKLVEGIMLRTPFVSATMDTVTEWRTAAEMPQKGALGVLFIGILHPRRWRSNWIVRSLAS